MSLMVIKTGYDNNISPSRALCHLMCSGVTIFPCDSREKTELNVQNDFRQPGLNVGVLFRHHDLISRWVP
jgi:hypothetical protein